jgi:hypothetical protein
LCSTGLVFRAIEDAQVQVDIQSTIQNRQKLEEALYARMILSLEEFNECKGLATMPNWRQNFISMFHG